MEHAAAVSPPAGGLAQRDREILAFERQWWKYAGAKEQAIRDLFGLSATRYYQLLNVLIDRPEALAADPWRSGPGRQRLSGASGCSATRPAGRTPTPQRPATTSQPPPTHSCRPPTASAQSSTAARRPHGCAACTAAGRSTCGSTARKGARSRGGVARAGAERRSLASLRCSNRVPRPVATGSARCAPTPPARSWRSTTTARSLLRTRSCAR